VGGVVEALIWHTSDTAVKPIVANRRIERLPEPRFEAKALPFPALTLQVSATLLITVNVG
jgi:serine/threonine-protein kinase ULK4